MKTNPIQPGALATAGLCALLWGALALPAGAQALPAPATASAPASAPSSALGTVAAPAAPLLRFADFFKLPLGARGAEMTPALLQANGQRVRLVGYMVQQELPTLGHFMLTPRPVQMSEHADGDADDLPAAWAMVNLDASQHDLAIPYQRGLLELSGVLHVGRVEESDGRVSWVRLQLDPDATRSLSAQERNAALHANAHGHDHVQEHPH